MDTTRICNQCRKPLPQDAPEGLCPECLARVALGSESVAPGSRVAPKPADLAGQFPQLETLELLGMGGMGMVYKARQPRLDRFVALKLLPIASMPDASFAERFEREAKALARLNHPGIVNVYDFGQTREYYYFVMEFVDGMNLRQLIQANSLEPRQALELITQICTALQFAHDEKIVHRDIKPENILITKKGQVKIADFGLAKLLGSQPDTALTASQMVMGTLNYMAPEQRENTKDVDHRADIYSLGVVFYEMLTGEVPMGRFDAPSKKVRIDVRLDEVVLHALEREPARRYQQVSEVKSNVETITSSMPAATHVPPSAHAPMPEAERVFSRSDVISIAKFILAIFICYAVGCFVPLAGLLMFCVVLLAGARKLSAQGKKPSVPLPATPPPGFVPFVLKRFTMVGGAWLAVGLCLHWSFGDAAMSETANGNVWSWSLGNWLVTFPPSVPVPLTYTILGMAASCFYLGFAGSVLSAIFILVTITWLEVRVRCGLTPRQLPPSIRRRHRFWVGATMAGYAVVALTTTYLCNIYDGARPFSMRDYQNVSEQATEFWFVPNSGAYQKLGFKAKFTDKQEQVPANGVSTLPTCTLSLILHRTNAEPVVMKVILPGLRASYRFPATNNWDNAFVLDKDSLAAWFHAAGGVDLSVPKLQAETDQVYEMLKAYQVEPPVTVKEFVNLGKADLRDFYFGGMKSDSFTIRTVQSNGILFVALVIESLIYLALHLWSTRRLFTDALAEIQSGRWTPPPAKPVPQAS